MLSRSGPVYKALQFLLQKARRQEMITAAMCVAGTEYAHFRERV
jgi:hypothetical protein